MPTEFKSADVESALLDVLGAAMTGVTVEKLTSASISDDGILTAVPPYVGLLYDGSQDAALRGPARRDYNVDHAWLVLCGAHNLRDKGNSEDTDAKALISRVRAAVAGVRLTLADGDSTEPIALAGSQLFQFDSNGTWYSQRIVVSDVAQFPGGAV
jgi:hypothetical protein